MPKLHCILDLDNTLICCEPWEELRERNDWSEHKERIVKNDRLVIHDIDKLYLCVERPYLKEFLDYLYANFDVSIWTAATKSYMIYIFEQILKRPETKFLFHSYHCDLSEELKDAQKSLKMLSEMAESIPDYNSLPGLPTLDMKYTFIIDDYEHQCETQPCNCILISRFECLEKGSENDTALKDLIPKLQKLKEAVEKTDMSGDVCLVKLVD